MRKLRIPVSLKSFLRGTPEFVFNGRHELSRNTHPRPHAGLLRCSH